MPKISGIYLITNTRNNLKYVGQSKDIYKRIREHFSPSSKDALIDSSINLEPQNFIWEILEECLSEDLNYYEQYYIWYFNSLNFGYNRDFGGSSVNKHLGENHHGTYYTNEEMLNIRKEYVKTSIEELYKKYKKNQSFYTFKNQVLHSFSNLPIYKKKEKKWYYPSDWDRQIAEEKTSYSGFSEQEIMTVRRLSMTHSAEEIFKREEAKVFKSYRQLREIINGKTCTWLPYFDIKNQKWIYPQNWSGSKEKELDESKNFKDFFLKRETLRGRKLSNYQVLQIRYLGSLRYSPMKILEKLRLDNFISKDAIKLILEHKTYSDLPYLINGEWFYPTNLTEKQIKIFPEVLISIGAELNEN